MTEMLPIAEARNRLAELATLVETTHERVVVTRNGRPSFALVALDDIESLEETLSILADPDAMADIAASKREIAGGEAIRMTRDETLAWVREHRQADARD